MTITEMHRAFKLGLDKLDGVNYPNFRSEEIDLILNQAQNRYAKQRYGINNIKRQSFEETQKRTEDLKELIRTSIITPTANSGQVNNGDNITTNSVLCTLPTNHWFTIWERAIIYSSRCTTESIVLYYPESYVEVCVDCPTCSLDTCVGNTTTITIPSYTETVTGKYVEVRPIQHLEVDKILTDPFKAPDYDKVLRLMYQDKAELIPAENTSVVRYLMRYIKKPATMNYLSTPKVDCELSEHTHQEIVDEAIKIALEGIEAKRIGSFTQVIDNLKE